jgi:hypothetical protein
VVAAINASIYLGRKIPDIEIIKDIAGCRHGKTIFEIEVIKFLNLPMHSTSDFKDICKYGGISIIMHPIFNLHAIFIESQVDWYIKVVNSWLGPNVVTLSPDELSRFQPAFINNRRYWVFNDGVQNNLKLIGILQI